MLVVCLGSQGGLFQAVDTHEPLPSSVFWKRTATIDSRGILYVDTVCLGDFILCKHCQD